MIDLGGFAFAAPWMLAALVIVPLIWWLLRITPPTPAHVLFPAVRLLFGLTRDEETPAKTPPWLIVLRMAIGQCETEQVHVERAWDLIRDLAPA